MKIFQNFQMAIDFTKCDFFRVFSREKIAQKEPRPRDFAKITKIFVIFTKIFVKNFQKFLKYRQCRQVHFLPKLDSLPSFLKKLTIQQFLTDLPAYRTKYGTAREVQVYTR